MPGCRRPSIQRRHGACTSAESAGNPPPSLSLLSWRAPEAFREAGDHLRAHMGARSTVACGERLGVRSRPLPAETIGRTRNFGFRFPSKITNRKQLGKISIEIRHGHASTHSHTRRVRVRSGCERDFKFSLQEMNRDPVPESRGERRKGPGGGGDGVVRCGVGRWSDVGLEDGRRKIEGGGGDVLSGFASTHSQRVRSL